MLPKAKILYFTVFILAVFAFIFHVTAMGHHHWKRASGRNTTETGFNYTSIGLFTRCVPSGSNKTETCFPNLYPGVNTPCRWYDCIQNYPNDICHCDFLPSTKGIASCAIIASIFLGVAIIILFINSIKTTKISTIDSILGFLPLLLLILAFIFILIALILVGSYLSRDMMQILRTNSTQSWDDLRGKARDTYEIRIDWSSGLEIIALVLTFITFILYGIFISRLVQ